MTDLDAVRARLAAARGAQYWRTLEEVADSEAFAELVAREMPAATALWLDPMQRRSFLKLMAAAFALGGIGGCTQGPSEPIVPYVHAPEGMVPGRPVYFATAMPTPGGLGLGLLVESHLGRPIKVEGNTGHPASLGATDAQAQASVLTLYDPDRLQAVTFGGAIRTWADFLAACGGALAVPRGRRGAGLRILTETVTSPTLGAQLRAVLEQYPEARWHQWEPTSTDAVRAGALAALGEDVRPLYRFADADVVVALDADFLGCGPAHLAHVREFAARRRPGSAMKRLYVAESALTQTGAKADHRLPLRAADVAALARALAAAAGVPGATAQPGDQLPRKWIEAVARDLARHRARPLGGARRALPRDVERRPRFRRHGDDRAAAHRPALRREVRARAPRRRSRRADACRLRPRARPVTDRAPGRRLRPPVAELARGGRRAGHGRHDALRPAAPGAPRAAGGPGAGSRGGLSAGPDGARRTVRGERLAPGAAAAAQPSHLGQRRPGRTRDGGAARRAHRGRRRARLRRPHRAGAGARCAGAGRGLAHRALRIRRSRALPPRRLQRVRDPHRRRALVRHGRRGPPDGDAPDARPHAASPADGGTRHRPRLPDRPLPCRRRARARDDGRESVPGLGVRRLSLGHGDRSEHLRRL